MPVTYAINELLDKRAVDVTGSATKYQRTYQVKCSERISEVTATTYVLDNLYGYGDPHPDNSAATVENVKVEDEASDGLSFLFTFTWSTGRQSTISYNNPLGRAPELNWDMETVMESIDRDYSSTPKIIKASNGQDFQPLPSREAGYIKLTYTINKSLSFFTGTLLPLFASKGYVVNSASFTIDGISVPQYYCLLGFSAQKQTEGSTTFYRITYTLKFRAGLPGYESDGWRERYLDKGNYNLTSSAGDTGPILDAFGNIVSFAWPLDGTGQQKTHATDTPAILGPFSLYPEVSFSGLF